MDFLKKHWACICLLAVACLLLYDPSISFAAGSVDTKVVTGSGGAQFNSNLESAKNMAHNVAVTVSTIMICLGGLMVAMNVDGPNKLLWNSMLGIGLALGFATFLGNVYSSYVAGAPGGTSGQPLTVGHFYWAEQYSLAVCSIYHPWCRFYDYTGLQNFVGADDHQLYDKDCP